MVSERRGFGFSLLCCSQLVLVKGKGKWEGWWDRDGWRVIGRTTERKGTTEPVFVLTISIYQFHSACCCVWVRGSWCTDNPYFKRVKCVLWLCILTHLLHFCSQQQKYNKNPVKCHDSDCCENTAVIYKCVPLLITIIGTGNPKIKKIYFFPFILFWCELFCIWSWTPFTQPHQAGLLSLADLWKSYEGGKRGHWCYTSELAAAAVTTPNSKKKKKGVSRRHSWIREGCNVLSMRFTSL